MKWPEPKAITLKDGRKLVYAEFGDSNSDHIAFYHHGWPACRYEAALYDPAAEKLGIRLIAIDRPGMGQSDFLKKRTIPDWPEDLLQLVKALNITKKFHVIGHSGGGPYALACAAKIPDHLAGAIVVAGVSPMTEKQTKEGMRKMNQFLLTIGKYCPPILNAIMKMMHKMTSQPEKLLQSSKDLPEVDRKVIETYLCEFAKGTAEAFSQGTRGATHEGILYSKPWGFDLESITIPVSIWQGDLDVNVPQSNSRLIAERVPNASITIIEGGGHLSIPINQGERILRNIVTSH